MSFLETLKELSDVAIEAIKENPVAAAGCAVGAVVIGGGAVYLRKRSNAKKAAEKAAADQMLAGINSLQKAVAPHLPSVSEE